MSTPTFEAILVAIPGPQGEKGDTGAKGLTARGAFVLETHYLPDDLVTDGGEMFIALTATNNNPTSDATKWQRYVRKGQDGAAGAKGDKGDKGDAGAQGLKGDKGDKGDTGETGATGAAGAQGLKGDKGDTGSQGPAGSMGATGAQGPKGDKGDTGETGAKGANFRGAYNSGTAYLKDDLVKWNGGTRIAKGPTTGNSPDNATYWDVFSEKGDPGNYELKSEVEAGNYNVTVADVTSSRMLRETSAVDSVYIMPDIALVAKDQVAWINKVGAGTLEVRDSNNALVITLRETEAIGIFRAAADATNWSCFLINRPREENLDHTKFKNRGTKTHTEIDDHIGNTGIHISIDDASDANDKVLSSAWVKAKFAEVIGMISSIVQAPDAITTLSATPGNAQVLLSWDAPADNGLEITDYIIRKKLNSAVDWDIVTDGAGTSTTFTVTGLTNDLTYNFSVLAKNALATSGISNVVTAIPFANEISPMAASQPPLALYSLRKIKTDYAGPCVKLRNSLNVEIDIGFDTNGIVDVAAAASHSTAGGANGTLTVRIWYDQSGNGYHALAGTAGPVFALNAITTPDGIAMPAIDGWRTTSYLATSASPLNIGGTANLAALVVYTSQGWGDSAIPYTRPGTYNTNDSVMLGYGSSASGVILRMNYDRGGDCQVYDTPSTLVLDASTVIPHTRNVAFNQKGADLSGFGGNRKVFNNKQHGKAAANGQRIVIGNSGAANRAANGYIYEVVLFNPASAALSDTEVSKMVNWQRHFWGNLSDVHAADRYMEIDAGQSLRAYSGSDTKSGNGTTGTNTWNRVAKPYLNTLIDTIGNPDREILYLNPSDLTAFAGSGICKASGGLDGDASNYWWDETLNSGAGGAGPRLTNFINNLGANVLFASIINRKPGMVWAQGETEAKKGLITVSQWKTYTKAVWNHIRTTLGVPNMPILIQPLGSFNTVDANMRALRLAQTELVAEVTNVHLLAETSDLDMQDDVHPGAMDKPNGFDLLAKRNARGIAAVVWGENVNWRGPEISGATKIDGNTIDVALTYPTGCSGTDFVPTTGIQGFEVTDGTGARTISAAVRQNATTIRLTISGAALSGTTTLIHNPQPAALDRTKLVVDNAAVPMPLRVSGTITVA